jgi:LiaI-LiaF-like transmembrane region
MKCAVHTDIDATGFCRNCGKALCAQCAHEVRGALYCEDCLARMVAAPSPAVAGSRQGPNPGVACALGFIPGLGAVYNGEYVKGLIHVVIFGGLIALMSSDATNGAMMGLIVVFFVAFCFYMPVEAFLTAKAKSTGQPLPVFFGEPAPPPPGARPQNGVEVNDWHARRQPIWAVVLIVMGALFLLGNFGFLDSIWVYRLWPLLLVSLGVWMIWKRSQ